jgi:hypothetical protein
MTKRILLAPLVLLAACSNNPIKRVAGQSDFISAPPAGQSGGAQSAHGSNGGTSGAGGDFNGTPATPTAGGGVTTTPRTVEETDLYRLEGDRLYYLNSYRGLMVFDVSNVDSPALLGRSPIYGSPVDMIVRNGIAIVVVADWYGQMDDGTPFHGSIVRGLDATDPTNIKVLGEAKLGGWVRDDRVVGDVIYAVSEDYGWIYGWDYDGAASNNTETVIVSSVSFANNVISSVGEVDFPGYTGVFNVTPNSILLAHDAPPLSNGQTSGQSQLLFLDISDPGGKIAQRGSLTVDGQISGWGADNGRWNLDFADGKTAHVVGCAAGQYGYCDSTTGYILSIADFTNPDAPALSSELNIGSTGWSAAARFDTNRLYLSPEGGYYYGSGDDTTPFQVFDLTNPKAPSLAGTLQIPGSVWNILPAPNSRLFALGNDYNSNTDDVSLKYLDVTNPSSPTLLGTSTFGQGWAWTPAAGTFKAFTMDATQGMVVLPFSGWDDTAGVYNDGLQLIDFTASSISTMGAAKTKGWVERGIFVKNRLVSLSDLSLAVVDYSNQTSPVVTAELTLARNVITAQPESNGNIAEISSDWWDNDVTWSEVRLLPIANAEETTDNGSTPTIRVDGVNARVFMNGTLAYVVTDVRVPSTCDSYGRPATPWSGTGTPPCYGRAEQVQVVDLSNGVQLRGKVQLPLDPWGWWGWGWWGFWWYDWWDGNEAVQVGGDGLAFRRWEPIWDSNGYYVDANSALWVVDAKNPDAPSIASVTITDDPNGWWGNMQVVGNTLYTGHYEWIGTYGSPYQTVRYYADRIDLSNRAHPQVGAKINVPGLIVGGSTTDPNQIYCIDYHWDSNVAKNDFDVIELNGSTASLVSATTLDGWVGSTFVRGNTAYLSAQQYTDPNNGGTGATVKLHALDLSNPSSPVDRTSTSAKGWGWLLDIEGDRAVVLSGWGPNGVDIYQIADGQAPQFKQFTRTLGWWSNGVSRQGNSLYLSSGYWGVQKIDLQ